MQSISFGSVSAGVRLRFTMITVSMLDAAVGLRLMALPMLYFATLLQILMQIYRFMRNRMQVIHFS